MIEAFEDDFFRDVELIHVEVDLLSDLWRDLQQEFIKNDWQVDEGLRFTLASGLAALRREKQYE